MRGKRSLVRNQGGMALAMAIVIIALCAVIVTGLIQYIISEYRASHADWRRVQALYAAEAGVERAVEALIADPDALGSQGLRSLAEDDGIEGATGEYEATIAETNSDEIDDPMEAKRIISIGYVPSKAEVDAGRGVIRRVSVVYSSHEKRWDFGADAVRARRGIRYGSNDFLTVVVDTNYTEVTDESVDASLRVTGVPPSEADESSGDNGIICKSGGNKATVRGTVTAPGPIQVADAYAVNSDPENYVPDAFPDPEALGYAGTAPNREAVWPPPPGTWLEALAREARAGASYTAAHVPWVVHGSAFIDMGGVEVPIKRVNTLRNVRLIGPGTVFVRGHLGEGVVNGYPPVTLVVLGEMNGNFDYTCIGPTNGPAPPLITFGKTIECSGSASWKLNGPLIALHPDGAVNINDSAMLCFGAIVSNGIVNFKSNGAVLGYPQWFQNQHFEMVSKAVPAVVSYSAR
jgi:hypothetical protein